MIYQPSDDSYLLEKYVKLYSKNKTVLDIGSASGILAKAAIDSKAKSVLATDIQDDVIKHLKKQNLKILKSNLFQKIKGKFDLIVFNPPYLPRDKREPKESQIATTGGKRGDEIILKFIEQLPNHLTNTGICLLLLSSLTPFEKIKKEMEKNNLSYEVLGKKKLFMETLSVLKIAFKRRKPQ